MTKDDAVKILSTLRPCGGLTSPCNCGYFFTIDGEAYALKVLTLGDDVDPVLGEGMRRDLIEALTTLARHD